MSKVVSNLLKGKKGIEIGASSWNSFKLDALNIDIPNRQMWKNYSVERGLLPAKVDIEADAANIPLENASQEFVFSSHMLEHHVNPIAALREWYRILCTGGIMVAIIPLRNASSDDVGKPLTNISEFVHRYTNPEMYSNVSPANHQTVWTTQTFKELIEYGNGSKLWSFTEVLILEKDDQVGNGFLVAFSKEDESCGAL